MTGLVSVGRDLEYAGAQSANLTLPCRFQNPNFLLYTSCQTFSEMNPQQYHHRPALLSHTMSRHLLQS